MKTLRDFLFLRHQAVEPKLDALREKVVASLSNPDRVTSPDVTDDRYGLREFFISLRWHLAGMGAAWLVIVLLHLSGGRPTSLASAVPAAKIPPPQMILASLRENRRELLEMIQPAEAHDARPSQLFPLPPRSQRPDETLLV
jgi:hypothetical protein